VLCGIIGLALLGSQIYDLREKDKARRKDQDVLGDLVTRFASHRVLYSPLDCEDIGEAVESVQILRRIVIEIVRGAGPTLSRTLAQRAGFYLGNFITEVDELERRVASTADAYISAFNEGKEISPSRARELYQKLKRPVFSTKNRIVVTGSAGISLSDLNKDFALDFVRAFYRMRGGFQEIFYRIEAAGVEVPQQLRHVN
jgi:hypothetical protein